ncbi:MAG TPA: hypothetical protein VHV08_15380, partial [Pirellulales bacterium]|nr:hypothetical protein [Pirellulales bacterium]
MARSTFQAALTCVALLALTLLCSGCANFPNVPSCIDPTGERFFKHDPNSTCGKTCKPGSHLHGYHAPKPINCNPEPGKIGHEQPIGLCITPQRIVAPVGAEVVLKAAICDQKGMTTANEKVEWTIAPGGVGHFVALGQRPWYDTLLGATTPNKITATYAVNSTSSKYMCLNRGTPDRGDDVPVIKGQAWVTVTSPLEGSSQITAFAPNVYGWDQRQKTATIYFVDAQWQFPPPASNPAGTRQTFTTSVARQTTGCPVPGWHVRYEIVSGPEAGLVPTNTTMVGYGQTAGYPAAGAKILEMPTDALGHASVDLVQSTPQPGTNQVSIQIIRPGEASL